MVSTKWVAQGYNNCLNLNKSSSRHPEILRHLKWNESTLAGSHSNDASVVTLLCCDLRKISSV